MISRRKLLQNACLKLSDDGVYTNRSLHQYDYPCHHHHHHHSNHYYQQEDGCSNCGERCSMMSVSRRVVSFKKLFIVLFFLFIAAFSNWTALAYIHDFVGREAIPDIVFSIIPEQLWALKIGDLMVTFCSLSVLALLFLHVDRFLIIYRTAFIVACLYTMRTISLLCTQLPSGYSNNSEQCQDQVNRTGDFQWKLIILRVFSQAYKLGFQDMDDRMLCGDLLFSGHTLAMVVSALTIGYYLPKSLRPLRYIPHTFSIIGIICMVISRTHYTIDVLFAYWCSVAVFSAYYAFCETEEANRKQSVLYNFWIMRMVGWLEADIKPGRPVNHLEFPILVGVCKWWTSPRCTSNGSGSTSSHYRCRQHVKPTQINGALPV